MGRWRPSEKECLVHHHTTSQDYTLLQFTVLPPEVKELNNYVWIDLFLRLNPFYCLLQAQELLIKNSKKSVPASVNSGMVLVAGEGRKALWKRPMDLHFPSTLFLWVLRIKLFL